MRSGKLRKNSYKLIKKILILNYILNNPKDRENIELLVINILMDFRYITLDYKISRIKTKKPDVDIDGLLGSLKFNLDRGIMPLKESIQNFIDDGNTVNNYD